MRYISIPLVALVAACNTTSTNPPLSFLDQVEQEAIKLCGYAPTITSISALVGAFVPGVSAAGPLAADICAAVNALKPPASTNVRLEAMGAAAAPAPRTGQSATVMVRGVAVQGIFTR